MKIDRRMVEREIFIADDGKEFLDHKQCLEYEASREFAKLLSKHLPEPITINGDTYKMVVYADKLESFEAATAKHAYAERLTLFAIPYRGRGLYFIGQSDRHDPFYGDIEIVVATKREDIVPQLQAIVDIVDAMDHILEEEGSI